MSQSNIIYKGHSNIVEMIYYEKCIDLLCCLI